MQQNTIKSSVHISGVGLHSGEPISLTLRPAQENSGIVFVRNDIHDRDSLIPALWDNVSDTRLCTVISNDDGVSVGTIEHLMSALRGCHIDNIVVELDGAEVPIMDGSAMPFVNAIEEAGIQQQKMARQFIRVLRPVCIEKDGKKVTLSPSASSNFSGDIEFSHPSIGHQHFETQLVNGDFKHDIAEARTFGFLEEVEQLRAHGLALGGSLDNAIVLNQSGVMNEAGLRFDDEFIRHKILDAIGDLYLAGAPILGCYDGHKAGHEMNNLILHELFAQPDAWEYTTQEQPAALPSKTQSLPAYA